MNVGDLVKISWPIEEDGFGIILGWEGDASRYGKWIVFYENEIWHLRKHHIELINETR